jgi:lipopolysaccharide/colanic/teichoic acid biosynthesis glycosyltransferase
MRLDRAELGDDPEVAAWDPWRSSAKRVFDVVIASIGLFVAAPLLAAVALAMRLSGDRGPFLHRALRVGERGSRITVLKVRTMAEGASGPALTVSHDARVTKVGRLIRRCRVDELPQLINVIRGEMSLVGPRPEDPRFVDLSNPLHRRVFMERPGITGLAQLAFHDEAELLDGPDAEHRYREVILPAKLRLDQDYLDHRSLLMDARILARTALSVVGWLAKPAAPPAR